LSSVSVRSLDREKVLEALRDAARALGASHPEVREVRLFGSLARGSRNPYADADLLIVLDTCDLPFRERTPKYKPVGLPVPADLIVCTKEELDREVASGNSFVCGALAESLPLYTRLRPARAAGARPP
jgi:predicted nucleotidyltransferase